MSHKGQLVGAKALAASIIDLLTSPELLAKARAEFEVESKRTPYFSLLPPDARPDLELNRVEMGEVPRGHAQVLSEQDAALQLSGTVGMIPNLPGKTVVAAALLRFGPAR